MQPYLTRLHGYCFIFDKKNCNNKNQLLVNIINQ